MLLQDVLRDANEFSRRLKPVKFTLTYFIYLLTLSLSHCSISKLLGILSQNRRQGSEGKTLHSHALFHTWRQKGGVQGWLWVCRTGMLSCGWGAAGGMGPAQAADAEDAWSIRGCSVKGMHPGQHPGEGRLCCQTCRLGTETLFPLRAGLFLRQVGPVWLVLRGGI